MQIEKLIPNTKVLLYQFNVISPLSSFVMKSPHSKSSGEGCPIIITCWHTTEVIGHRAYFTTRSDNQFIPDFMTRVEYVIREWELPCGTWDALPKTIDARLVKLCALR